MSSHNQRCWKEDWVNKTEGVTMIRQHNHYHLWKLVRKLEWRLFKKGKGVATGAMRQGIPEFPHLSTGMLDEQCLPAVNLHSCGGLGWFVMIPAYLLLCFIPSLRVREWRVLGSCRSHGTHSCSPSGVQALWSEEFLGCLAFAWLPWSPPRQCSPFML